MVDIPFIIPGAFEALGICGLGAGGPNGPLFIGCPTGCFIGFTPVVLEDDKVGGPVGGPEVGAGSLTPPGTGGPMGLKAGGPPMCGGPPFTGRGGPKLCPPPGLGGPGGPREGAGGPIGCPGGPNCGLGGPRG